MEILEMNEENCLQLILDTIEKQKERFIIGSPTQTVVLVGDSEYYNREYIEEHNLFAPKVPNIGGVMILSPNDIEIAHFSKDIDNRFNFELADSIIEYITGKGINIKLIDNDLIIDGTYKCGSFSSRRFNNIIYSAFHVSINCNLELIKAICTKPMKKIPKGLSDYGITTTEIRDLIEEIVK